MTINISSAFSKLSDQDVLARLDDAVRVERCATAKMLGLLMDVDTRRLYLGEGCSSLFTYCTQVLHLSEHAAYNRIETARAARRFPTILALIESGAVTLTAVRLLAPHFTEGNHGEVLERATHMSRRQVEALIAKLHPKPDVPSVIRKLPTPARPQTVAAAEACALAVRDEPKPIFVPPLDVPRTPPEVKPLAPERYKIQVTVSRQAHDKLRRAQDLLRHSIPTADASLVIERALDALVDQLERTKTAATQRPHEPQAARDRSRHIPAAVKRVVWQRDGGRCAFNGARGRCTETGFLEYHHVVPFASGGAPSASNIELRCRAHNQYEADLWFGASKECPSGREDKESYGTNRSSFRNEFVCTTG